MSANAQPYNNAVGVTFIPDFTGNSFHAPGVQWKHFFNAKNILDIRAGYQMDWGPLASALYEWNFPVGQYGFNFYAGPGVHAGIVNDYNGFGDSCLSFGLNGAAGFEYVFYGIPLAISIDWRPFLTWEPAIDNAAMFGWKYIEAGVKFCF